jgi:archaellum biogenesis protein FlaJ (TadC family)
MTVFGDSINFLVKLGVYDIILPFLLVFVLVFALLEKTKVLGVDLVKGKDGEKVEYTKKSLNAMVAFVTGFFVVASTQLVAVINQTLSQVFLLLLLVVCFLMVWGTFHQQNKDGFFLDPKNKYHRFYYKVLMAVVMIAIVMIFLNALGWLDKIYEFLKGNWNTDYVAAVVFILLIIGLMAWITKDPDKPEEEKKE